MSLTGRNVTVVGGGIAGLAASRALAMRGAQVTVYEQAAEISEVGAGIQVSPNGGHVLAALGLGAAFEAVSGDSSAVVLRDQSGRLVLRMNLEGRGRFGLVHRADLISVLEAGARDAGVRIVTGAQVSSVVLGAGDPAIVLACGETHSCGLLIGADGVQSQVRGAILGERAPDYTGHVAWRALVAGAAGVRPEAQVFMAPGQHVVVYPLRGGTLLNIVAVEERAEWQAEGWHHAGDPSELRARFAGFGGPVRACLERVEACKVWGLFKHPVAERWHSRGVALAGDAAHPTLPFLAQGACMALEDAWVLARMLADRRDEAEALTAYQAQRRDRVVRIVDAATANARNYHLSGVHRLFAHSALRALNRLAPGAMLGRFDWLYGNDVTL